MFFFFRLHISVGFIIIYSNSQPHSLPLLLFPLSFPLPHSLQVLSPPLPTTFWPTRPLPVPLPVGAECSEREHGHADGGELDDGDQLAAHFPKHPLVKEVARGVHRDAGEQQQQVPCGQVGDEDVGGAPHGAVGDEDLHQHDVAQQAHRDDEQIERRDHTADHELGAGPLGGGQKIPVREPGEETALIPAGRLGKVAKGIGGHGLFSRRVPRSFPAPRCPEKRNSLQRWTRHTASCRGQAGEKVVCPHSVVLHFYQGCAGSCWLRI